MSFPGVTSENIANAALPVESGGLLTSIGGMLNPVAGILGGVGGLSSMFGGGASSDVARAGGTFYTGAQTYKGSSNTETILIVVVIALGLFVIFKGKK